MSNIDKLLEKLSDDYVEPLEEGILMDYFAGKTRQIWELALTKLGVDQQNIAKGLTAIVGALLHKFHDDNTVKDKLAVRDTEGAVSIIKQFGLKNILSGAHAA